MSRFFFLVLSWSACFALLAWSLHISTSNYDDETLPAGVEEDLLNLQKLNSTVYIIRHAEKPEDGKRGLSRTGRKRAECIAKLFGPDSEMDISYIIAAPSNDRVKSSRSIDTVRSLAKKLDLGIDSYCDAANSKCVAKRVKKLQKAASKNLATSFNVLIAGRHTKIRKIAKAFGVDDPPVYPDAYGLTWQIHNGELKIWQQHCPEVDEELFVSDLEDNYNCDGSSAQIPLIY